MTAAVVVIYDTPPEPVVLTMGDVQVTVIDSSLLGAADDTAVLDEAESGYAMRLAEGRDLFPPDSIEWATMNVMLAKFNLRVADVRRRRFG